MPPVYSTTAATARLQVSVALINSQTPAAATGAASPGSLVIGSSAFTSTSGITSTTTGVLAIVPLPTAGTSVSGRVATLISSAQSTTGTANAGASGTQATTAAVINNAGAVVFNGLTVGTSGTDVVISGSTTITTGETVTVNSLTVTHP